MANVGWLLGNAAEIGNDRTISLPVECPPSIPLGNRNIPNQIFGVNEFVAFKCAVPDDAEQGDIYEVTWHWYALHSSEVIQATLLITGLLYTAVAPGRAGNNYFVQYFDGPEFSVTQVNSSGVVLVVPSGSTSSQLANFLQNDPSAVPLMQFLTTTLQNDEFNPVPFGPTLTSGGIDNWESSPLILKCKVVEHPKTDLLNEVNKTEAFEFWKSSEEPPPGGLPPGTTVINWEDTPLLSPVTNDPDKVVRKSHCSITLVHGDNSFLQFELLRPVGDIGGGSQDQFAGDVRVMGLHIRKAVES